MRRGFVFPILLILVVCIVFFWQFFFLGKIPIPGDFVLGVYHPWIDHFWGFAAGVPVKNPIMADVVSFTYPMQTLAISLLKSGQAPLWNPYILTGTPLLANFQSAPFAITNIVYLFLSVPMGWGMRIFLQHALLAINTYFLLKYWKRSDLASIAGGLFFAFSGFNMIWSQWNAHALTASFIPLIILFVWRFFEKGKLRDIAFVSICIALQIFSGYPQVVIYTLGVIGLITLLNFKRGRNFVVKCVLLGFGVVVGVALAGVQVLPAYELLSLSQRSFEPHPFEWAFLPLQKVITFVAVDFYGNHATGNWWGPQDYTSNTGYVGVIASILSITGLFFAKRNKVHLFLFLLMVVSLLFSFPTPFSISLWKSGILGFQAASAHRALVLFCLGVALSAGFGIDQLLKKVSLKYLVATFPAAFLIGIFVFLTFTSNFSAHRDVALKNLVFPILFLSSTFASLTAIIFLKKKRFLILSLLVCLSVFELFRFGWKFTPFISDELLFPETPLLTFLKNEKEPFRTTGAHVVPINLRMNYNIEAVEGYDAVYPSTTAKFLQILNSGEVPGRYGFVNNDTQHLLPLINTKYVISLKGGDIKRYPAERYERLDIGEPKVELLLDKKFLSRSFLVYDWEILNKEETINEMSSENFQFAEKALVDIGSPLFEESTAGGNGSVTYMRYEPQRSDIKVETSSASLLVTTDLYYPGWRAYLDGSETPILNANFAFRAVLVPKGVHLVSYRYEPPSYKNGLIISAIASLLILLLVLSKSELKQYN